MQYNDSYSEDVFSFANNINTHDGGTHLIGFRSALTRTINTYAASHDLLKNLKATLTGDDIRAHLPHVVKNAPHLVVCACGDLFYAVPAQITAMAAWADHLAAALNVALTGSQIGRAHV